MHQSPHNISSSLVYYISFLDFFYENSLIEISEDENGLINDPKLFKSVCRRDDFTDLHFDDDLI